MRRVIALSAILAAGCTKTKHVKSDEKEDLHVSDVEHRADHGSETRIEAPTDTSSSTSSQEFGVIVDEPDGGVVIARVSAATPLALPRGARVVGTVPIEASSTTTTTHQGGATDTKSTDSCEDVGLDLTKHTEAKKELDKTTSWWPPLWLWLAGGLLVAGAAWLAWKAKPPWITAALGIAKKL